MMYRSVVQGSRLSEKVKDLGFVFVRFHEIAHAVVGAGNYQQFFGRGACHIVFVGHFNRNEMVVGAVNEHHRQLCRA